MAYVNKPVVRHDKSSRDAAVRAIAADNRDSTSTRNAEANTLPTITTATNNKNMNTQTQSLI